MPRFNLIDEVNQILEEFERVDFKDINSILGWFYKAIYHNSMYTDLNISNYLYNKLRSNGYMEIEYSKEAIKDFYSLLNRNLNIEPNKIANAIISQIMFSLKNSESFDEGLNSYIKYYNEKYNHDKITQDMMSSLKEKVGSRVVYVKLSDGEFNLQNGIIESVEEYQAITINGERIPFVGYNTGIKTIYSTEGKYLYNNERLTKEMDLENLESIREANLKTFGDAYRQGTSMKI